MAEHLLIVDDEVDFELLIKQWFYRHINSGKYIIHFASNGQEALNKIDGNPNINVVVTDINMPVMTGLELLKRINERQTNFIKVVVVSAYSDMDNIRYAMNKGAFDFLTKPVDLKDLEATIEKTVENVKIIRKSLELKKQIEDYNRELESAKEIQQAIIPKVFPPFPKIKEFDIYGHMKAAKLVGGDFFDYFLIDDNKVGFVIGDVSGKGMPAAIFMAVSQTIIHSLGKSGLPTNECLSKANQLLCNESVESMFVTVFYGVLDFKTGELKYTNAGHNYPFIIHSDGHVTTLDVGSSVLLGAFDDGVFYENTYQLTPNSCIVLYTDGVNEAVDVNNRQLGTDVIMRYLTFNSNYDDPKNVTDGIFELVYKYSGLDKQSSDEDITAAINNKTDDITVLTLSYKG